MYFTIPKSQINRHRQNKNCRARSVGSQIFSCYTFLSDLCIGSLLTNALNIKNHHN